MDTALVELPAPTSPAGILRRVPRQDRGQRRIERILDAAPEVADRPLPEMMRGIGEPIMTYCEANPASRHVFAATTPPGAHRPPEEAAAIVAELVRMLVCALEPFDAMRPPAAPAA